MITLATKTGKSRLILCFAIFKWLNYLSHFLKFALMSLLICRDDSRQTPPARLARQYIRTELLRSRNSTKQRIHCKRVGNTPEVRSVCSAQYIRFFSSLPMLQRAPLFGFYLHYFLNIQLFLLHFCFYIRHFNILSLLSVTTETCILYFAKNFYSNVLCQFFLRVPV